MIEGHATDDADRRPTADVVAVLSHENRDSVGEHTAIMEATIERKADDAISLLNAHYERTTSLLLKLLPDRADPSKTPA